MLLLTLNKRVTIQNVRINAVYYSLMCFTLAAFLLKFFLTKDYTSHANSSEYVKATLLTDKSSKTEMIALWTRKSQEPLCKSPRDYDYWWDAAGDWAYVNNTCLPLCQRGMPMDHCINPFELHVSEGQSQVFIVTHMQETFGPSEVGFRGEERNNYVIPFAEAMGVSLTYRYDLPVSDDYLLHQMGARSGSSTEDIRTVVFDSTGQRVKTIEPNESITLSVAELLGLAGHAELLDSTLPEAGSNKLPNAHHGEGPLARISGLEMVVDITCSRGSGFDPLSEFYSRDTGEKSPTCSLSVHVSRQYWSQTEQLDAIGRDGRENRHRLYHGIRIRCRTHGHVEYLDFNQIFVSLVSFLVIMKIPKQLMYMFMVTSLGHLSRIYHKVLNEVFYLPAEICGIATRLMAAGVSFVGLMDHHASGGISKARLRERLYSVLSQEARLDTTEMQHFVDFAFQCLTHAEEECDDQSTGLSRYKSFREMVCLAKRDAHNNGESQGNQLIDVHTYAGACCTAERIGLHDVVLLFHADRRMNFLERYFLPRALRDWSKVSNMQSQSMRSEDYPDITDDRSDVERGIGSISRRTIQSEVTLDSTFERTIQPEASRDSTLEITTKSYSPTSTDAATLSVPRLALGRCPSDSATGFDERMPRHQRLESEKRDLSANPLPRSLEDRLTLEEEKELLRWSLQTVGTLTERDIEMATAIDAHLCRIEKVEKAIRKLERSWNKTFEDISNQLRAQEENARQDTLKVAQAMDEKLGEFESEMAGQHGELHYKLELMGAHFHASRGISSC